MRNSAPSNRTELKDGFGRWLLVSVLLLAYMLSFLDRQVISLLVAELRRDLAISDMQIGLLQGPAFGVFYAVMGLPLGWLADRTHRIRLIAAALLLWTVMTILGGFATSYSALLATRMGVGVGEAALVPAAISLLADRFPPDRRALPMAIFTAGVAVGAGMALLLGGALIGAAKDSAFIPLVGPLLAGRATWQVVLILAGLAGIPLALAILLLPEPGRSAVSGPADSRGLFRYLGEHRRLFVPLLCGSTLLYIFSNGLAAWLPTLFVRGFGWTAQRTGASLGFVILGGALAGNLLSGTIATAVTRAGRANGTLLTMAGGAVLLVPAAVVGPLANTPGSAQTGVLAIYFSIALCFGVAMAAFVAVTPAHLRGQMVALYVLLGNLFGLGLGPPVVGLLLYGLGDPAKVGLALSILAVATVVGGALLLLASLRRHAIVAGALLVSGCATIPTSTPLTVPQMVRIEPGQFVAGSTPAETDTVHYPALNAGREQPARRITVAHAFAIGLTEVTRGQFAQFVAATHWKPDGPCSFLGGAPNRTWRADAIHDWLHPGYPQTDAHPVVCVDLADAMSYAAWISVRTGRHFRLPSNTEWEYAARAGTVTPHFWDGDPRAKPCDFANLNDLSSAAAHADAKADRAAYFECNDGYAATAPVGSFRPNPWGLYDMIGNVWEWTTDCLNDSQLGAPSDTDARATGRCASHIDRGSSWGNSPKYVRAAAQHPDLVGARTAVLGFRLVEDLPRP